MRFPWEPSGFKPYKPDDIKAERGKTLKPHDVWKKRATLFTSGAGGH